MPPRTLFTDDAPTRKQESADDRKARVTAERAYSAGVMARSYAGTRADDWLAYFEGKRERPVAWGSAFTRQPERKRAVTLYGVFIPFPENAAHGEAPIVVKHTLWEKAA